jgi:chaperonin GroES
MLKPLGDHVIVQTISQEEVTAGGIFLPETAQQRPQEGLVIAVGPGRTLDNGTVVPLDVKEGDRVIYARYGGTEVTVDGEDYLILGSDSLLAVRES